MRIMIAGDTHGNSRVVRNKAREAHAMGCDTIFIVGDFGLWPGVDGVNYLDDVNAAAREYNLRIIALPGNHEDHDQWKKWFEGIVPLDKHGFAYVRSNVLLTPKVQSFKFGKKRFFVAGGAVSIDKQWRIEGKSWWKNEEFTEDNLRSVESYNGPPIDFLLTHDCSDFTHFGFTLKVDPESQANRQRIDRAINVLRPAYHFHGHMHQKYEWTNTMSHGLRDSAFGHDESEWNGYGTKTYGLDCDGEANSFVVLDTGANNDEMTVSWPDEARRRYLKD